MEIPPWLIWVGGTVGSILAALGVSNVWNIVRDARKRRYTLEDRADDQHQSNQGKQIDDNALFRKELMGQVKDLRAELKEVQAQLNSLMVEHADTKAENRHLKEKLIHAEAESNRRGERIVALETEVRQLQKEVAELVAIQRGDRLFDAKPAPTGASDDPIHVETKEK
jgi:dynactin complex subunit